MYKIIGGDLKQYGPISAADVRKWLAEGRLNAQSLVQAYGDIEWKQLSQFPEFAEVLTTHGVAESASSPATPPTHWLETDYELDIGACIGRSWELYQKNFGLLFGGCLLYMVIEFAMGMGAQIPLIGPVFSVANLVLAGPLLGGIFYMFLQAIRAQPATVGDIFAGFRTAFLQLFLGYLVPALLAGLCMVPFVVVLAVKLIPVLAHLHSSSPSTADIQNLAPAVKAALLVCLPIFFVCMIPMIYLHTSWMFTLPLIIDRQMGFWTAMKVSWKRVNKHWWHALGLLILVGLINAVGVLLCCAGALFKLPIGLGAVMYAYETVCSRAEPQNG